MGQKAITIYTPAAAEPHITADDDAFIYHTLLNGRDGILGDLTCTKIDNNTVRLTGGGCANRGHILRIPDGENLDLTVTTGTAGYKRYDCVVAEFEKGGGSDADSYAIKIVAGALSSGTPTPPTLTTSDLTDEGDVNQIELFRLYINGTTLSTITQIAPFIPPRISVVASAPSTFREGDIFIVTG